MAHKALAGRRCSSRLLPVGFVQQKGQLAHVGRALQDGKKVNKKMLSRPFGEREATATNKTHNRMLNHVRTPPSVYITSVALVCLHKISERSAGRDGHVQDGALHTWAASRATHERSKALTVLSQTCMRGASGGAATSGVCWRTQEDCVCGERSWYTHAWMHGWAGSE